MSLTDAMSIALTGLNASMSLISLTSNNISNAQTPGYSTKNSNITSVDYGTNPGGVHYNGYTRTTDAALIKNYNLSTTSSSYYNTLDNYLAQIQNIMDATSDPPALSNDVAEFASAWSQYSVNPESSTNQLAVINAGNKFAKEINNISTKINSLALQTTKDIQNSISGLNSTLRTVASLNSQIQAATTSGQSTADLQDKLDAAVQTVASYTNVSVQNRSNGQIALYTTTGQPLVDQSSTYTFSYDTTSNIITDQNSNNVTGSMNGGSLEATVKFLSTSAADAASTIPGVGTIAKLKSQLQSLVSAFTSGSSSFATAYSAAVTTSTASTGTQNGHTLASSFFTVTLTAGLPDLGSFAVTTSLLTGAAELPEMSTPSIVDSFSSTTNYTASGLNVSSATYSDLTSAILVNFQQMASTINDNKKTTQSQTDYFKTQLANTTGVNLDEQLANLTMYQNSYAASAHIISSIKEMMDTLLNTI